MRMLMLSEIGSIEISGWNKFKLQYTLYSRGFEIETNDVKLYAVWPFKAIKCKFFKKKCTQLVFLMHIFGCILKENVF